MTPSPEVRSRRWAALLLPIALVAALAACEKSAESLTAAAASAEATALAASVASGAADAADAADAAAAASPGGLPQARLAGGARGRVAGGVAGTANRLGSQLAYEHDVRIRVEGGKIAGNLSSARDACMAQTYGVHGARRGLGRRRGAPRRAASRPTC